MILGLVILILVLVLCVPIRYDLKGRYNEGLKAKGGVHWLLKLLHIKFAAINAQILVKVNVLGHCFKKMHIGKWDEEPAEDEAQKAEEKAGEKAEEKQEKEEKKPEPAQPFDAVFAKMDEEAAEQEHKKKEKKEEQPSVPAEKTEGGEDLKEWFRKAEEFLDDEKNQYTIHLVLKQLRRLGKHLLPTKFLIEGKLGTGDPAKTGEIVGKVYRFYPLYGDHIRLDGVYDEKVTDVYAELAGRIRLGVFVEIAVRLLLNKNFRSWLKQMKKDKNEEKDEKNDQPGAQPEAAAA